MFNLIEVNSGDTVDFWILTDQPFDVSRFARKYAERIMDISAGRFYNRGNVPVSVFRLFCFASRPDE
jgi:hypothetical protein